VAKKTKLNNNERIDLVDFERVAGGYSDDNANLRAKSIFLDKKSGVLDGFRVQIDDQTATPGQITIFNGNAIDRSGRFVNEESAPEESITVTLSGASTSFYVEVEYTESDSDSDSRMFWDPTYDNGGAPTPDGKEFPLATPTRVSATWKVVNPIATTGFEADTTPTSTKIPLVKLVTDGTNKILVGSNPGLSTENGSSVLIENISIGATSITVKDARHLAAVGSDITIDLGGATPETGTVSAIDRVSGIVTFAPAVTAAHTVGAIIDNVSTGTLLVEKDDPSDTSAHPDYTHRLFQGNEKAAIALTQSKSSFGDRNDLNLQSEKNFKDTVAGLIRELKFGNMDPGVVSTAPPTSFASRPRYFDPVGSLAGARTATVSIGDGVSTFGDFNGTDETPFTAALAALPSGGGKIYVKEGTYTFANSVTVNSYVTIVGESNERCGIVNNAVGAAFVNTSSVEWLLTNVYLTVSGGSTTVIDHQAGTLIADGIYVLGNVDISGTGGITATDSSFVPTTAGISAILFSSSTAADMTHCTFSANASSSALFGTVNGNFNNCTWSGGAHAITVPTGDTGSVSIHDSMFFCADSAFSVSGSFSPVVTNSYFSTVGSLTSASDVALTVHGTGSIPVSTFTGCSFSSGFTGTSLGSEGTFFGLRSTGTDSKLKLSDCSFTSTSTSEFSAAIRSTSTQAWAIDCAGCNTYSLTSFLATDSLGTSVVKADRLIFDGGSVNNEQRVFSITGTASIDLAVKNSRTVSGTLGGTGSKYFIYSGTSSPTAITADSCSFESTAITSTFFDKGGSAGKTYIRNCTGDFSGSNVKFVSDSGSDFLEVSGCAIPDPAADSFLSLIGYTNTSGTLVVRNNKVTNALATVASGTPSYFVNTQAINSVIDGNVILGHDDNGTSTSATIYVDLKANANCEITNNIIDHSAGGIGGGAVNTVYVAVTTGAGNIDISGNSIKAGSTTTKYGPRVVFASGTDTSGAIKINNNQVDTETANVAGIYAVLGDSVSLEANNNNVQEISKVPTSYGIFVQGDSTTTSVVNVSNNTFKGIQSATARTGNAIYVAQSDFVSCTGNAVDIDLATTSAIGIKMFDVTGASITGNSVNASTTDSISVDTGVSTNFLIVGNAVNGGTISPTTTAGTHVVANNI